MTTNPKPEPAGVDAGSHANSNAGRRAGAAANAEANAEPDAMPNALRGAAADVAPSAAPSATSQAAAARRDAWWRRLRAASHGYDLFHALRWLDALSPEHAVRLRVAAARRAGALRPGAVARVRGRDARRRA